MFYISMCDIACSLTQLPYKLLPHQFCPANNTKSVSIFTAIYLQNCLQPTYITEVKCRLVLGALNLQDRKMTDNITGGGKCGTGN